MNTTQAAAFFQEDGTFIGKYAPAGPLPATWLTVFCGSAREAEAVRAALTRGECPDIPLPEDLVRVNDMHPHYTSPPAGYVEEE